MTRPVRGFITKHGNFFPTKMEAALHEATTDFHAALTSHLEAAGLSNTVLEFIVDKTREFVLIHKDVVMPYITLMKSIPEVSGSDIRSVLLQPTTAPVDEPPTTEADEIDEDFIQAFEQTVGTDDGSREDSGNHEVVRQSGET